MALTARELAVFAGMRSLWATVVMQGWQLGLGLSILSPSLA